MEKKDLKLKALKIKSFVTKLEDKKLKNVKGGDMYLHATMYTCRGTRC